MIYSEWRENANLKARVEKRANYSIATIRESREDVSIWKTKACLVSTWLRHAWSFCPTLTPFRREHTPHWALWRASQRSIRRRWPAVKMFISIQTKARNHFLLPPAHTSHRRQNNWGKRQKHRSRHESQEHIRPNSAITCRKQTPAGFVCWPVIFTLSNNGLLWKWFMRGRQLLPSCRTAVRWDLSPPYVSMSGSVMTSLIRRLTLCFLCTRKRKTNLWVESETDGSLTCGTSKRCVPACFCCSAVWRPQMLVRVNEKDAVSEHRECEDTAAIFDLLWKCRHAFSHKSQQPKENRDGSHVSVKWNNEQQRQVFECLTNTLTNLP